MEEQSLQFLDGQEVLTQSIIFNSRSSSYPNARQYVNKSITGGGTRLAVQWLRPPSDAQGCGFDPWSVSWAPVCAKKPKAETRKNIVTNSTKGLKGKKEVPNVKNNL